eukprot:2816479-Pleurochrysis_carterae.AAC.1
MISSPAVLQAVLVRFAFALVRMRSCMNSNTRLLFVLSLLHSPPPPPLPRCLHAQYLHPEFISWHGVDADGQSKLLEPPLPDETALLAAVVAKGRVRGVVGGGVEGGVGGQVGAGGGGGG